ncbi:hypothetical protein PRIPAC_85554, partial [Pristionchus pacificus]
FRMTDDSKIVLRWEIDNAAAKFDIDLDTTERLESEVFDKGGFKWNMIVEQDAFSDAKFGLKCEANHNGEWKCEAGVEVRHYYENGIDFNSITKKHVCFKANDNIWTRRSPWHYGDIAIPEYIINGMVVFEFHIKILSSVSESGKLIADPSIFTAPNELSNVILKIGDTKLHVSKEYLAIHSPVFKTMFFGEFAEKEKDKIELKDVVYEELVDLLHLIYVRTMKITDRTVLHILKLADRFQVEYVLDEAIRHLADSKKFDVMAKLLVADNYNLADLKEECLNSFSSVNEMQKKMMASPDNEYGKFSAAMKVSICDKMMKLKLQ